jgi:hypothetical protein
MCVTCAVLYYVLYRSSVLYKQSAVLSYNKRPDSIGYSSFVLCDYSENCVKQHSETETSFPLRNVTNQKNRALPENRRVVHLVKQVLPLIWITNVYHTDHKGWALYRSFIILI